jgi:hypothetical protein
MSRPEETLLRTESGFGLKQKGDKKWRFNPPTGTLILTDTRLIFARSGEGLAKRMVAGGLFGEIGLRALTKVKPEELDKALERPDSFHLNLQDISEVKNEGGGLGLRLLSVQWAAPDNPKALFYRTSTGMSSTLKGFDEWIKAIQDARKPTPTSQSDSVGKPCTGCGQQIPENVNFCPKCGVNQ